MRKPDIKGETAIASHSYQSERPKGETFPIPSLLDKFVADSALSPVTLWRYRKKGWLKTLNICGRQYVTRTAIAEFNMRAERGEFAKECQAPRRSRR